MKLGVDELGPMAVMWMRPGIETLSLDDPHDQLFHGDICH